MGYIASALLFFYAGILLEYGIAHWRGLKVYSFKDSIANLGCGIWSKMTPLILRLSLWPLFFALSSRLGIPRLHINARLEWILVFVVVDLHYYWWHRLSHEVNLMWAAHVVHHQSEEYNLSVALRQAFTTDWTTQILTLPLLLLGFDPMKWAVCGSLNTLYQFWIHTRLIGRLGPLEWILNTPSHHRVHHGINPRYIDRNYAGVLIIWDRLFGSFQEEAEPVVYGIVKPLRSFNPLWAHLHYGVELAGDALRAPRLRDKFLLFFKHPGWRPQGLGQFQAPPPVDATSFLKFRGASLSGSRLVLAALGLAAALAAGTWILRHPQAPSMRAFEAALVLCTVQVSLLALRTGPAKASAPPKIAAAK